MDTLRRELIPLLPERLFLCSAKKSNQRQVLPPFDCDVQYTSGLHEDEKYRGDPSSARCDMLPPDQQRTS